MKLRIKKGLNLSNALELIKDFFEENCSEYDILKGDLNMYVTLKNRDNEVCPLNDKEYRMSDEEIVDVFEEGRKEALDEVLQDWEMYYDSVKYRVKCIERKIRLDREYLSTAEEKGRSPKNIEKRKIELEKHLEEDYLSLRKFEYTAELDEKIKSKEAKIWFVQYTTKMHYQYSIRAGISFSEDLHFYDGSLRRCSKSELY